MIILKHVVYFCLYDFFYPFFFWFTCSCLLHWGSWQSSPVDKTKDTSGCSESNKIPCKGMQIFLVMKTDKNK